MSDSLGENFSLLELFRSGTEQHVATLTAGLLEIERGAADSKQFEGMMRAAHSLKGNAAIVELRILSRVAHAMEDCLVAAQEEKIRLGKNETDVLLRAVDFFTQVVKVAEAEIPIWETAHATEADGLIAALKKILPGQTETAPAAEAWKESFPEPTVEPSQPEAPAVVEVVTSESSAPAPAGQSREVSDRVVRVAAETVNRLLGLAGESLVESRRLQPFAVSMQRLKRLQSDIATTLDGLRQTLTERELSDRAGTQLTEMFARVGECREFLAGRIEELETFDRRATRLSHRLYQEALQCRMRPFADGVRRFPRMVRDLAHSLGKEVKLELNGDNTQVDRDILEKLDAPLTHLLRNAIDHGCETADERRRQNKPPENIVKLEARHSAGMLLVSVADDGRGIDAEKLRAAVVRKKMVTLPVAEKLSEPELMEFLFLPGFSTKEGVTEVSGRGVGLDVVRDMVKSVRGKIHVTAHPGRGTRFQLQLPITLSVIRALLVEVAGEPYAIPLAQIVSTQKLPPEKIQSLEGRRHFTYGDEMVGLISARQIFNGGELKKTVGELPVVVLGDRNSRYGLMVDRFLGQKELVVQPLDARLGKVRDISSAATMEDGSPVLIVDVEDMVRSIEKLVAGGLLRESKSSDTTKFLSRPHKRVLVVDDSPTVRALEKKLLTGHGYEVEVAVDGMDGWNAVRAGSFDLLITDVDMPRMDGLELVSLIKRDARLKTLPVLMLSHKDRDEDRRRGLAAGADGYLTKSSFRDEVLLQEVGKLIGKSEL